MGAAQLTPTGCPPPALVFRIAEVIVTSPNTQEESLSFSENSPAKSPSQPSTPDRSWLRKSAPRSLQSEFGSRIADANICTRDLSLGWLLGWSRTAAHMGRPGRVWGSGGHSGGRTPSGSDDPASSRAPEGSNLGLQSKIQTLSPEQKSPQSMARQGPVLSERRRR